ncbi:MAG: T9SS type A sorting domain-containing protein [Candidatus Zixiibacteriota bacterium]
MTKKKRTIAIFIILYLITLSGCYSAAYRPLSTHSLTPEGWAPLGHPIASNTIGPYKIGFIMTHRFDEERRKYIFSPCFEALPDYNPSDIRFRDSHTITFTNTFLSNGDLALHIDLEPDTVFQVTRQTQGYNLKVKYIKLKSFELDTLPAKLHLFVNAEVTDTKESSVVVETGAFNELIYPYGHGSGLSQWATDKSLPNPFSPTTTLSYTVNSPGPVTLVIYDVQGKAVDTLVNTNRDPGIYHQTWDARDTSGHSLPSGIYFYKITTPDYTDTKKMVLLK